MSRATFPILLLSIEFVFGLAFFVALALGLLDGVLLRLLQAMGVLPC